MQYIHTGVPTTQEKNWSGYVESLRVHYVDPTTDPYNIEWLKFDDDAPMHEMVKTLPHVAYRVDDLDAALKGKKVIFGPMVPFPGLIISFIDHEGAVVELSQVIDS